MGKQVHGLACHLSSSYPLLEPRQSMHKHLMHHQSFFSLQPLVRTKGKIRSKGAHFYYTHKPGLRNQTYTSLPNAISLTCPNSCPHHHHHQSNPTSRLHVISHLTYQAPTPNSNQIQKNKTSDSPVLPNFPQLSANKPRAIAIAVWISPSS